MVGQQTTDPAAVGRKSDGYSLGQRIFSSRRATVTIRNITAVGAYLSASAYIHFV